MASTLAHLGKRRTANPPIFVRFTIDQAVSNLELHCRRDDGIIVYLDGKEVGRDNMSEGADSFLLPAVFTVADDELVPIRFTLEGVTLPAGEHLLAISLHNTAKPSSDLRIGGITLVEVRPSPED